MQQPTLLFSIPSPDDLPEILNDFVGFLVATIIGVFLPVVHINISNTTDQKLEFSFVKDIDEIGGNQLVEAGNECVELLFDTLFDLPFCEEPKIISDVLQPGSGVLTQHIPACSRL